MLHVQPLLIYYCIHIFQMLLYYLFTLCLLLFKIINSLNNLTISIPFRFILFLLPPCSQIVGAILYVCSFIHICLQVNCVAFSQDFQMLVTGSDDQRIRIFNTNTAQFICKLKGHEGLNKISSVILFDFYCVDLSMFDWNRIF